MTAQVVKAKNRMDEAAKADHWTRRQAEADWRRVVAMPGEPFAEIGAAL
jgi:phage terminase small subunit